MSAESKSNGILKPPVEAGPEPCVVIVFDPKKGMFGHKFTAGVPIPGLVNHLELIKAQLVMSQLQGMRQKPGLLLPDGSPAGF
jgi:hypothetical protein